MLLSIIRLTQDVSGHIRTFITFKRPCLTQITFLSRELTSSFQVMASFVDISIKSTVRPQETNTGLTRLTLTLSSPCFRLSVPSLKVWLRLVIRTVVRQ